MKAVVAAFNQEKALVGAFSVIVQPVVEPMDRFIALLFTLFIGFLLNLYNLLKQSNLHNVNKRDVAGLWCQAEVPHSPWTQ